jgi:hypothetical protein
MQIERYEDTALYEQFCNTVDHREIGRHTKICLEAAQRLASTLFFHTMQHVVEDTLMRELQFHTMVQITGVTLAVIMMGAFHNKYIKSSGINHHLPSSKKEIKFD